MNADIVPGVGEVIIYEWILEDVPINVIALYFPIRFLVYQILDGVTTAVSVKYFVDSFIDRWMHKNTNVFMFHGSSNHFMQFVLNSIETATTDKYR